MELELHASVTEDGSGRLKTSIDSGERTHSPIRSEEHGEGSSGENGSSTAFEELQHRARGGAPGLRAALKRGPERISGQQQVTEADWTESGLPRHRHPQGIQIRCLPDLARDTQSPQGTIELFQHRENTLDGVRSTVEDERRRSGVDGHLTLISQRILRDGQKLAGRPVLHPIQTKRLAERGVRESQKRQRHCDREHGSASDPPHTFSRH